MATYTTRAGLGKPTAGQTGWGTVINRTIDLLDGEAALGGFAVRPAAIDASTGQATDLRYTIGSGRFVHFNGDTLAKGGTSNPRTAPASATTYVWMDPAFDFQAASALPTSGPSGGAYPLAKITTDATRITAVEDLRFPASLLGVGYYALQLSATDSSTNHAATKGATVYAMDATGGPLTVTLPALADANQEVYLVVKSDAGANAVTVQPAGSDAGPTVTLSGRYDAALLFPYGPPLNAWLKLKLV